MLAWINFFLHFFPSFFPIKQRLLLTSRFFCHLYVQYSYVFARKYKEGVREMIGFCCLWSVPWIFKVQTSMLSLKYKWRLKYWTDEKVIFLTREKEKLDHVRDCLLLMGVLYLRCSACVIKNKIVLPDCCETDRQRLFFVAYCWFSHDVTKNQTKKLSILTRFYFHVALEQLKTNCHTNFRFKRVPVLGFVIEYAWMSKLLRDAAFTDLHDGQERAVM